MSPAEIAASGSGPEQWAVNIAFLIAAIAGAYGMIKKGAKEGPAVKPRAEIAIGDAAILDTGPLKDIVKKLDAGNETGSDIAAHLKAIALTLGALHERMQQREKAEEDHERDRRLRDLEDTIYRISERLSPPRRHGGGPKPR